MGLAKLGWMVHRFPMIPMPEFFPFIVEVKLKKGFASIRTRSYGHSQIEMHFAPSNSKEMVKSTIVFHVSSHDEIDGLEVFFKKRICINGRKLWVSIGSLDEKKFMTN